MVSDIFAMPSNRKKQSNMKNMVVKILFLKNQRCKYDYCLVNLQYTPPLLHIQTEWNILFRFLELLPTALGCCVVWELLLLVIIALICHWTTRYCLFVCQFFFSYFPGHVPRMECHYVCLLNSWCGYWTTCFH